MAEKPVTNGEVPQSHFIHHLTSYPLVSDTLTTYKSHPYGAKSLSLAHQAYSTFLAPIHPYLRGPYSYVAPYLAKADTLGDSGLSKLDSRFPVIKEDTQTLRERVTGVVGLPLRIAGQGREYLLRTYDDEYGKVAGPGKDKGVVTTAKAVVSTELRVTSDVFKWAAETWAGVKEGAKKVAQENGAAT
ncbi:hypothetical protein EJ06DRAFT_555139 [Trichodelitschia bisporula]|uniref:CAP20-like protein n=1 Tax=Trichodelitschia bisporula TaxID=703511 RepID=A0A6G1I2M6_9PEZI|nr:hypothetical protein EJ06DRAFT_555139 [Trichodelitschia bisporula]